jgi:UDP-N-acetylglucosamine 2-epimerase (non-hydrolysing)
MKNNQLPIYIVIGTRAQFIKVAPLMRKLLDQKILYTLIYTAQHRENIDEILQVYDLPEPNFIIYDKDEANTRGSFINWFLVMIFEVIFQSKKYIPVPGLLLTHGDTFTTWLAALMGKFAGCKICHVESGQRSFNLFSPFPEELSRLFTFYLSDIYFCSDEWSAGNLKKFKGEKIILGANTMIDGVRYALSKHSKYKFQFQDSPYVLVSIHRFENIFTSRFTDTIIPLLEDISEHYHLVMTLHPTTRERLISLGIYDELSQKGKITLHDRFTFVDWIHLCNGAEFVITDGGSNQQELSYLGVPTLLFRNETENKEGLNQNVVISKFDKHIIDDFLNNLENYKKQLSLIDAQPTDRIINVIMQNNRTN